MRTQRITKGTAITLLSIMVGGRRHEEYLHELHNTVRDGIPSFVPDGCKVFGVNEKILGGSYTYFYITGYACDGSDVERALARAMDKSPVFVHRLTMEQAKLWEEDKDSPAASRTWRISFRQMATQMARRSLTAEQFARGDTFIHNHFDQCLDGWNNTGRYQHGGV